MTGTIEKPDIGESRDIIKPGSYVLSKCGRDRGRLFIVTGIDKIGIDENKENKENIENKIFVYLADGMLRKVEKPKKKKLKHVSPVGGQYSGGELTNKRAASSIKELNANYLSRCGCITIEEE